jgi:hypothetical protein
MSKFENLEKMEKEMINFEKSLLDFLKTKNKKCFYVDKLNVEAPIFGKGNVELIFL